MAEPAGSVANRTRLEILRLVAELESPVGAETLARRLAERGIAIGVDGVRWHLRVLDEQGLTARVATRGRNLTEEGWRELRRSLVDARMMYALARIESLSHQVTFDPATGRGEVVVNVAVFPAPHLPEMLTHVARVFRAGLRVADRVTLLEAGEKLGGVLVPAGHLGLVTLATTTVNGLLLSRGLSFRSTFGGIVEVAASRPFRFVDVLEFGRGSRDPVEVLTREGSTRINSFLDSGNGFVLADVREVVGVARERARRLLQDLGEAGLGGVLALGQVGQSVLGVPVQQHTCGIVMAAGLNAAVAAYEQGVPAEFHASETTVEFSTLRPIGSLLSNFGLEPPPPAGRISPGATS